MRTWRAFVVSLAPITLLAAALAPASCAPSGFADPTLVQTVRVLASSADHPYAKPGSEVTLQVLAYDGRPSQPAPMSIYWLPFVCENPVNDAYYGCFEQIASGGTGGGGDAGTSGGGDAGAGSGGGAGGGGTGGMGSFVGADGVVHAPTGPSFTFRMPSDAVTSHTSSSGTPVPYGLAIVFNIACAGRLQIVPIPQGDQNPQTLPIGCFDANGNQLGPDDWVFGFTRIYAYDSLTNDNPIVSYVDIGGGGPELHVTPQAGAPQLYSTPACNSSTGCLSMHHCTGDSKDCQFKLGPVLDPTSWQVNTAEKGVNGNELHEELWVDFYTTLGSLADEARLLYDSQTGKVGDPSLTDTTFTAPSTPGTGYIWMIVHDNRGGASWVTIPVLVE
jgi:hypothetical protein